MRNVLVSYYNCNNNVITIVTITVVAIAVCRQYIKRSYNNYKLHFDNSLLHKTKKPRIWKRWYSGSTWIWQIVHPNTRIQYSVIILPWHWSLLTMLIKHSSNHIIMPWQWRMCIVIVWILDGLS